MESKTRRWRRSAFTGYFAPGHEGSVEENAQGRSQSIQALSPAHGPVMEGSPVAVDQNFSGAAGDFPALLRSKGLLASAVIPPMPQGGTPHKEVQTNEAPPNLGFQILGGVAEGGGRPPGARHTEGFQCAAES